MAPKAAAAPKATKVAADHPSYVGKKQLFSPRSIVASRSVAYLYDCIALLQLWIEYFLRKVTDASYRHDHWCYPQLEGGKSRPLLSHLPLLIYSSQRNGSRYELSHSIAHTRNNNSTRQSLQAHPTNIPQSHCPQEVCQEQQRYYRHRCHVRLSLQQIPQGRCR